MTLIVALKYNNGIILCSDRRVMYGDILKRDLARKLEPLGKNKNFGIAGSGLLGAMNEILENLRSQVNNRDLTFQEALGILKDLTWKWHCENIERFRGEDKDFPTFVFVCPEKIVRVFSNGYSEEVEDYACEGSGRPYAEYILRNFYEEKLSEDDAKELALYTIIETSRMDPNVSEDADMLIFSEKGCTKVPEAELEKIKSRIAPFTRKLSKRLGRVIKDIVENRKVIRDLSKKLLGFELFYQNEEALWRITIPCKTEEDFTTNVCCLSLLIDEVNCDQLKKVVKSEKNIEGSINLLEEFLKARFSLPNEEAKKITANFRDIKVLRSKKAPIHSTQPQLIETILKLGYSYPPDWSSLWIDVLNMYNKSLEEIKKLLKNELEKEKELHELRIKENK